MCTPDTLQKFLEDSLVQVYDVHGIPVWGGICFGTGVKVQLVCRAYWERRRCL